MTVAYPMATWFEARGVAALLTLRVQDLILFCKGEDYLYRRGKMQSCGGP
jgi:hypothetical protein